MFRIYRIKSGIDFEVLKKFGFYPSDADEDLWYRYLPDNFDNPKNFEGIAETEVCRTVYVDKIGREVFAYNDYYDKLIETAPLIGDLIKAGVVEKGTIRFSSDGDIKKLTKEIK